MTYREMQELVKEKIRKGEKLHGAMLEIAFDLAVEEAEKENAK